MVRSFRWNGREPYGTGTSWVRHDYARRPSSNTAIASFARDAEPGAWDQPKTVVKWRKRTTVEDLKTGPKAPHSTTLSEAEEAMVVAFRRHTLLPLDDCLYGLCQSNRTGPAHREFLPPFACHQQSHGLLPRINPSKFAALTALRACTTTPEKHVISGARRIGELGLTKPARLKSIGNDDTPSRDASSLPQVGETNC